MSVSRECSYSPSDSFEYTALQFAVRRNSIEQVKYLIESGTELDTGPDPALHLALRRKNITIGILLLEAGANFEIKDSHGDLPIHIACTLGLLEVVKVLCALGCSVEVPNVKGLYPLHLAAKNGNMSVVRCLCAAGCNIEVRNSDNIRADITALKYGYNDIADILDRLRALGQRDHFARQLVPTSRPALRLSLRLLGHCGVGKTSLAKSLGAGLFSSLFKRSSSLHSNKSRPSSPINTQIEMDVTSRQNSINFEPTAQYQSTSGIHVQNLDISNVGDITVWDFSGQETYFSVYHHFLWASPYSVTAILFSLDDPPSLQIQQVCFWLNFLLARQSAELPTCEYGQILLVATHVDLTRAVKTQHGEWVCPDAQKTLETVKKLLPHVPNFMDTVVIMDSNVPASFAFKQFKSILSNIKQNCIQQTIGTWTGLLENTLSWLNGLRSDYEQFPVLNRSNFSELLRSQVNLLASDDHINELLNQLHVMGEVYCIDYLIVLSVSWLGAQLLGELLSSYFISNARVIGVYTAEDFQSSYTQCDAVRVLELLEAMDLCVQSNMDIPNCCGSPPPRTLYWPNEKERKQCKHDLERSRKKNFFKCILNCFSSILHLMAWKNCLLAFDDVVFCVYPAQHPYSLPSPCEVDSEIEYEFPIYNQIETLEGLWDSNDPRYAARSSMYGGLRLFTSSGILYIFKSIFSHIQVYLRKTLFSSYTENDSDLYQWCTGSKLCNLDLESLISLEEDQSGTQYIEIKVRGPNQSAQCCFYFLENIMRTLKRVIGKVCPGLLLETHILSPEELRLHSDDPYCYSPQIVTSTIMEAESTLDVILYNPNTNSHETISKIIMFDDTDLARHIQWGCVLSIQDLPGPIKLRLCGILDPPESHGRDWCLLALRLGLCQKKIAALDSQHSSHTMRLLTSAECTIGALITSLHELDRQDAADVVLKSAPIFKVIVEHAEV